ncbi:MAG: beta-phosphoglucomutase [Anaerolineae bacterium]|nr:beta-phosphoglucomutase [Anaerolineae bacterium]MDW8171661.1 beta-phosphoglucomutase [Anaerolineae bacterium]
MDKRLWTLREYPFHPEKLRYHETIFTVGNGYLGTRASFEEGYEGDTPATLVHGLYNHAPHTQVPELVNAPNWTEVQIKVDGTPFRLITRSSDLLNPPQGLILGYERALHLDEALLRRVVLFRAASGATVRIIFERFASLHDPHILAQRIHVTAIDGAPEIELEAVLDGQVSNNGVQHWATMAPSAQAEQFSLFGVTNQSGYKLTMASALLGPGTPVGQTQERRASSVVRIQLGRDDHAIFDKLTAVYTSRDCADPTVSAATKLAEARATGYDSLLAAHRQAWKHCWQAMDITIEGDDFAQLAVRFTTYHLLIAAPQHDEQVSIGAKTLSGLGYKGHVFWDTELFMLPPFTLTLPSIARNMLMYRYHRLEGARQKARENGYEGAMFPWESTDTGLETTPKWSDVLDKQGQPLRIWTGDNEQHISTDIAYAVLQYWRWTGDDAFMTQYGAEIVLDTAVFWGSRAQFIDGRYELHDQIGPDEYHENVKNSVFVNRMVVWHLQQALQLLTWLEQHAPQDAARLVQNLDLNAERLARWRDIIANMIIPFDEARQIHVQFDGFFDFEYIPVQHYEPRVGGLWGYLGHERALRSQVIKQADVVMLMALLGEELAPRQVLLNNWETYYPRCDHGSSLSPAMHAWVAARLGLRDEAYHMLRHALAIDLEDNKGNVADGIHGAACGGAWQAIVFGLCGLHLTSDGPALSPQLPPHWKRVGFKVVYQGQVYPFVAEA